MDWSIQQDGDTWRVMRGDTAVSEHAAPAEALAALEQAMTAAELPPVAEPADVPGHFRIPVLVPAHGQTDDDRVFTNPTWRNPPLPLMLQTTTDVGHFGAIWCGTITGVSLADDGTVSAEGFYAPNTAGIDAMQAVNAGLRGISMDATADEIELNVLATDEEGYPTKIQQCYDNYCIAGATITPIPAFRDAYIENVESLAAAALDATETESITTADVSDKPWDGSTSRFDDDQFKKATAACRGSGAPTKTDCFLPHHEPDGTVSRKGVHAAATFFGRVDAPAQAKDRAAAHLRAHYQNDLKEDAPPSITAHSRATKAADDALAACADTAAPSADWFLDPALAAPSPLVITAEGRIHGHAALWGTCHVGRPGECLTPPRSTAGYAYFHTGEVLCADGSRIATGCITLGTGHADLSVNANRAAEHYDHTGTAVADVVAGEDEFGVWVAGALRPGVSDEQIHCLRASAPSGDWRRIGGGLEMVALLAVNVPGFPVPRGLAAALDGAPCLEMGSQPRARQKAGGEVLALVAAGVRYLEPVDPAQSRLDAFEDRLRSVERTVAPLRPTAAQALSREVLGDT